MFILSSGKTVNNDEKFKEVSLSFDRQNVVRAMIPQASIDDHDIPFVRLRIGHHLNDHFVIVFGVLCNNSFDDFSQFESNRSDRFFFSGFQFFDTRIIEKLIDLIFDQLNRGRERSDQR